MLIVTSSILFTLATIHIGLSLQELLEAFIYIPSGAPLLYSTLYWVDQGSRISLTKDLIYSVVVCVCVLLIHESMLICCTGMGSGHDTCETLSNLANAETI